MTKSTGIGMGRKGILRPLEHRMNISKAVGGEKNSQWVGDEVKYKSLHQWVRRNAVIPESCENCGKVGRLDAANISGSYLRDLSDWKFICRKCHMEEDGRLQKWQDRNSSVRARDYHGRITA